jgi:hypothetical protein
LAKKLEYNLKSALNAFRLYRQNGAREYLLCVWRRGAAIGGGGRKSRLLLHLVKAAKALRAL